MSTRYDTRHYEASNYVVYDSQTKTIVHDQDGADYTVYKTRAEADVHTHRLNKAEDEFLAAHPRSTANPTYGTLKELGYPKTFYFFGNSLSHRWIGGGVQVSWAVDGNWIVLRRTDGRGFGGLESLPVLRLGRAARVWASTDLS